MKQQTPAAETFKHESLFTLSCPPFHASSDSTPGSLWARRHTAKALALNGLGSGIENDWICITRPPSGDLHAVLLVNVKRLDEGWRKMTIYHTLAVESCVVCFFFLIALVARSA